ncbi:MAG: hypothetical protein ABIL09_13535 [Gemmatimonadota bacterium]
MGEVLRRCGWTAYDRLGGVVALNLLWDLAILPWVLAGLAVVMAAVAVDGSPALRLASWLVAADLVLLSAPSALLCAAAGEWLEGRSLEMGQLLRSRARALLRAQAAGLLAAAATAVLSANAAFYTGLGTWLGAVLGGAMLWFLLGLHLVALYLLPAAVGTAPGAPLWRQIALLAAGNLRFTAGLMAAVGLGLAVGVASGLGLLVGVVPALAVLLTAGYRHVLARAGAAPLPPPERRSLRDLARPWLG